MANSFLIFVSQKSLFKAYNEQPGYGVNPNPERYDEFQLAIHFWLNLPENKKHYIDYEGGFFTGQIRESLKDGSEYGILLFSADYKETSKEAES